jgi:hypothetical protein
LLYISTKIYQKFPCPLNKKQQKKISVLLSEVSAERLAAGWIDGWMDGKADRQTDDWIAG